jgi:hypothetical protein
LRFPITSRRKQITTELRLEDVFDAIWLVVGNRHRLLPPHEESRLRHGLAKLIVELEVSGVTNPRELRRRAIEEIVLTAPERDAGGYDR